MVKIGLTVIIPTLNGGERFRRLLARLAVQSVIVDELLVVDSDSDDATVAIAEEFGAHVIPIKREEFDHGSTRSMAAKRSSNDYLLFLTQDAVPDDRHLIERLLVPLLEDQQVVMSYGRQIAAPDATIFAKTLRSFNYPEQSEIRNFLDKTTRGLKTIFASNSCALYRKDALEQVGFFPEGLIFGEDTCVAGRIVMAGYAVAYVAEAVVVHSHNYSLLEEFRRSFDIGVLHTRQSWLLETFGKAEGEGLNYVRCELCAICRAYKYHLIPLFFCRNSAKYCGYKLGRMYYALPRYLVPKLSMNRAWWSRRV